MRTVPVQIVCRKCTAPFRTTVRGGNTRCPECRTSRHVRLNQEWEGPVPKDLSGAATRAAQTAQRPPVWVECGCGHEWQSRAKDRMTIRCPECGTGQRVPHRTHENTGPRPEGRRAPAPPPARYRPEPRWEPDEEEDQEDEHDDRTPLTTWFRGGGREELVRAFAPRPAAPAPGGLAAILSALQGQAQPSAPAAAPRPPRPSPAPRPAPAPAPVAAPAGGGIQPIDPQTLPPKEVRRRDDVCQIVRSLSASLMVWYNQPAGLCEALDTTQPRDRQRCPATASHVVRFRKEVTEADAYVCPSHARPLAATADHAEFISATIYRRK